MKPPFDFSDEIEGLYIHTFTIANRSMHLSIFYKFTNAKQLKIGKLYSILVFLILDIFHLNWQLYNTPYSSYFLYFYSFGCCNLYVLFSIWCQKLKFRLILEKSLHSINILTHIYDCMCSSKLTFFFLPILTQTVYM